jgi:hypothetical protein
MQTRVPIVEPYKSQKIERGDFKRGGAGKTVFKERSICSGFPV